MSDIKLTIFTPTYNRGYIIKELYESLLRQSNKNFEWIVVDDGSNDNTKIIFEEIIKKQHKFDIFYKYTQNGGKHRAINRGIEMASGNYFMIVDSDDKLTDDAIEKIINWIESINNRDIFAGVAGLRGYSEEESNGNFLKRYQEKGYIDATNLERRKYKLLEDKCEVYRLEVLKKYKFPEFSGETFIPEAIVWDSIANDGYKIRWFNEIIYIGNYLDDGLTKSKNLIKNNIKGYREYVLKEISFTQSRINKYRLIGILAREESRNNINNKYTIEKLNSCSKKYIIAYMMFYKLFKKK